MFSLECKLKPSFCGKPFINKKYLASNISNLASKIK
jgi:hypothetical protein